MNLPEIIFRNRLDENGQLIAWDTQSVHEVLANADQNQILRTTERALESSGLLPIALKLTEVRDELGRQPKKLVLAAIEATARRKRHLSLVLQVYESKQAGTVLFANDGRLGRRWLFLDDASDLKELRDALQAIAASKNVVIWPHGEIGYRLREMVRQDGSHDIRFATGQTMRIATIAYQDVEKILKPNEAIYRPGEKFTHLDGLEAESIQIMREVAAQAENPVMLYSVGKDSSVMLHLAKKAFYPSSPPFPLMHVDTRWKFQAMYQLRDETATASGMDMIVYVNPDGVERNINPLEHGSALHTDIMKTEGLKQALVKYQFDVSFAGARRDEEKSRAKERVFSFRTKSQRWDPKNQRPELWSLYNGYKNEGESIRVFPLSNWTELDIWQYIYREQISIVPLYFAAERPVIERDGLLILVDDDRLNVLEGEEIKFKRIRFRTLGCYPLSGAIESDAADLSSIVLELLQSKTSERQGRAIDSDSSGSMEKKKQEGYF